MRVKNAVSLMAAGLVTSLGPSAQAGVIAWSASGSDPAYINRYIWVMNDDGSNQVQLTSTTDSLYPDISPDGTKIVFAKLMTAQDRIINMTSG